MMVALHPAPEGFFKLNLPHDSSELFGLIRKASSLSFKCFQVGLLSNFVKIDGKHLKTVLDQHGMERNVHVGGLYDAEKFALTEEEYRRTQKEIHYGIELCREITSTLVSFHPPFFTIRDFKDKAPLSKARTASLR